MTDAQHQQFENLACELSPENLCCDGMLSRAQVRRREANIMRRWRALEKQVGRTVTEAEVWKISMKRIRSAS